MTVLAFIPARGGSKGIPRKNITPLGGRPLICYTLDTVREMGNVVMPFISTDDEDVADVCAREGFVVTYRRPPGLANDSARLVDAVHDALTWLADNTDSEISSVMVLQPTTPFRNTEALHRALKKFETQQLESMIGVVRVHEHPYECIEWHGTESWAYVRQPSPGVHRRQQYSDSFYFIDGSLYIATPAFLQRERAFVVPACTIPFDMAHPFSVDIDDPSDLRIAEAMLNAQFEND
jgi:CMP-N,N'-diacetyllegionaminic acid synthase